MLELQCNCGWRCVDETQDGLLAKVIAHMPECPERTGEPPLDEGTLRALVHQMARPVGG